MRRIYLVYVFLIMTSASFAQPDTQAGYLRYPHLPPFDLLQADSTVLTRDNLKKNKNTLILFFSPGCDHCRQQTDSLVAQMNKLKNVEIVMATSQSFEEMKEYYARNNLAKYPNLKVGKDIRYFFPPFYRMVNLPYLALYNEKRRLITTFEGVTSVEKLVESFRRGQRLTAGTNSR